MTRPRVLLSAYACEPDQGSEPGVGWRWAAGLASRTELTVLTRRSNQPAIEARLAALPRDHELRSVRFVYHDLGRWALALKKRGILPTFAYYVLWQGSVARVFADLADGMEIVHHLTFCSLLCPGLWRLDKARSVIGPVGAPLVPAAYLALFGPGSWAQWLRGGLLRSYHRLPWLKRVLGQADAIVPANSETSALLKAHGFRARPVMLDTGSPESDAPPAAERPGGVVRFLYAGRLERRKGLEMALRAFALARERGVVDWEFEMLGSGPDQPRLRALASRLGLGNQVCFAGLVPHEEIPRRMAAADVFFFPSVRDTSGGVNLEAMAMGLPILCIAHQGVGDITDETCAIRVPPGDIDRTIEAMAEGIRRLCEDPGLRRELGAAARRRALSAFRWEDKFDLMAGYYREVRGSGSRPAAGRCHPAPEAIPDEGPIA